MPQKREDARGGRSCQWAGCPPGKEGRKQMSEPISSQPSRQSDLPAGAQPPAAQALPLSPASIIAIVAGLVAIVAFFALAYFHVGVQVAGIQIEHAPTGRE